MMQVNVFGAYEKLGIVALTVYLEEWCLSNKNVFKMQKIKRTLLQV